MSVCQSTFETRTQAQVDSLTTSCSAECFLEVAIAADNVNTNRKISVVLGCQLPDLYTASIPTGTMIYVDELGVPVVATANNTWKGLDGRTYRNDTPYRELWAWGNGNSGRLGIGNTTNYSSPVQEYTSNTTWCTAVAASSAHTVAVKCTGELYAWGNNGNGRLGVGNTTNYSSPVQEFCSDTTWCMVSGGCLNSAGLKTDGTAWVWGYNFYGQIGNNSTASSTSPKQEAKLATDWCVISNSGCLHTVAVKTSGQLWGWGYNANKQLGDGTTTSRRTPVQEATSATDWCTVSAGSLHTVAVKTTGTLYGWGLNGGGQAGDGTAVAPSTPVQDISGSTSWCMASAGHLHSVGIKTDGTVWGWGTNDFYNVGDATTVNRSSPVQEITSSTTWCTVNAGRVYSGGIKTDGTLWSWGWGSCGRLGVGTTSNHSSPVQEISSSTQWCEISNGYAHTVALKLY